MNIAPKIHHSNLLQFIVDIHLLQLERILISLAVLMVTIIVIVCTALIAVTVEVSSPRHLPGLVGVTATVPLAISSNHRVTSGIRAPHMRNDKNCKEQSTYSIDGL